MRRAIHASLRRTHDRIARIRNDERGVSAVEFALILPVMALLFLGTVEVTLAVTTLRKLTLSTRTLGDIVSQMDKEVTLAKLSAITDAAFAVMKPYATDKLSTRVTAVNVDPALKATVEWSYARGTGLTSFEKGLNVTSKIPPKLLQPGVQLIWSEGANLYKPMFGYVLTGEMNLNDRSFTTPRSQAAVFCSNCP